MPGYIINLNTDESLRMYMRRGAYGTQVSGWTPSRGWPYQMEYTLADYVSMRPGELVFFFRSRLIYGVGRLVGFAVAGQEAVALENFPGSTIGQTPPPMNRQEYLWVEDGEENIRWVVFFDPFPHFFRSGLDMDEVLQSDVRAVAHTLRTFEGRSFAKMEDEEAQLILDLLLRHNQSVIDDPASDPASLFPDESTAQHEAVRSRGSSLSNHMIKLDDLVRRHADTSSGQVRHEALVHAWLSGQLASTAQSTLAIFGHWDYIANLVPASPQKPVQYMDKMDIFGVSYRSFLPSTVPTPVAYRIVEVKKDIVRDTEAIEQLMKYVAWVAHSRAGGDYGPVHAYFVARGYTNAVVDYVEGRVPRDYIIPRRPYGPRRWDQLHLVQYEYTGLSPIIDLSVVRRPPSTPEPMAR